MDKKYIEVNRASWNQRAETHFDSEFYDVESFLKGKSSLNPIELDILGNIKGKSLLHAMCHFGQDTLSLARLGAITTGVDISDVAIKKAKELSKEIGISSRFVNCDFYSIPKNLGDQFDIFFSSYGVIGWLDDLERWAITAAKHTKKGGRLILVEFHPVIWMYDDDFEFIQYNYFKADTIATEEASYTEKESADKNQFYSWNHSLSEVIGSLIKAGFKIEKFKEYNYSPYDCFRHTKKLDEGKYIIKKFGNKIPMVYALEAIKS